MTIYNSKYKILQYAIDNANLECIQALLTLDYDNNEELMPILFTAVCDCSVDIVKVVLESNIFSKEQMQYVLDNNVWCDDKVEILSVIYDYYNFNINDPKFLNKRIIDYYYNDATKLLEWVIKHPTFNINNISLIFNYSYNLRHLNVYNTKWLIFIILNLKSNENIMNKIKETYPKEYQSYKNHAIIIQRWIRNIIYNPDSNLMKRKIKSWTIKYSDYNIATTNIKRLKIN